MALERPGYERFGLMANPFQDLTSETVGEIEAFHVDQDIDANLSTLKQDTFEKRQKGMVAIVGPLGVGKTERLCVTQAEAQRVGAFAAFFQVNYDNPVLIQSLAECLLENVPSKGFQFTQPAWKKAVAAVAKGGSAADPERAGKAIAELLAAHTPAFLLVNDLHNLQDRPDCDRFLLMLQAMSGHLKPGSLVLFTTYVPFFQSIDRTHAPLMSRFNRVFMVPGLNDEQGRLMLAKRLSGHRIVEDLDPLYPFEPEAVAAMVRAAGHNPRRFLQIADLVLEKAVKSRAYRIDMDLATAALPPDTTSSQATTPAPAPARSSTSPPPTGAPPPTGHVPLLARPAGWWTCEAHPDIRDARAGECPECDAPLSWTQRPSEGAGISAPTPQ